MYRKMLLAKQRLRELKHTSLVGYAGVYAELFDARRPEDVAGPPKPTVPAIGIMPADEPAPAGPDKAQGGLGATREDAFGTSGAQGDGGAGRPKSAGGPVGRVWGQPRTTGAGRRPISAGAAEQAGASHS